MPDPIFDPYAYATFRPGYPAALFEHVLSVFDVGAGDVVVDAGCGTGQLAIPLAKAGARVVAVDVSDGMLEVAAKEAERARVAGAVRFAQGRAEDLADVLEGKSAAAPKCVVFGASFHWMDHPRVLAACDACGAGGVVLCSGDPVKVEWHAVVDEVVTRYAKPTGTRRTTERWAELLARHASSAFPRVTTWRAVMPLERTAFEVAGLAASLSTCAGETIGYGRQDEMRKAIVAALATHFPGESRFAERYVVDAVIARRASVR